MNKNNGEEDIKNKVNKEMNRFHNNNNGNNIIYNDINNDGNKKIKETIHHKKYHEHNIIIEKEITNNEDNICKRSQLIFVSKEGKYNNNHLNSLVSFLFDDQFNIISKITNILDNNIVVLV